MKTKNLEQSYRGKLQRAGYTLRKSRVKNWSFNNQQGYMIIDTNTNSVIEGVQFDMTLEDVGEFIKDNR